MSENYTLKDFSVWNVRHPAQVTTASGEFESIPLDVQLVSCVRMLVQSNNNGVLNAMYTLDKVNWFSIPVTPYQDVASGRYIYEWTKEAPLIQVKYKYTETASVGNLTGGFATCEKVGV